MFKQTLEINRSTEYTISFRIKTHSTMVGISVVKAKFHSDTFDNIYHNWNKSLYFLGSADIFNGQKVTSEWETVKGILPANPQMVTLHKILI